MCLELLGTLGQTRRMRRGRPRVLKVSLHFWNRPKLALQALGKLAIRLQALDRKLNVPGGGPEFLKFPGTLESPHTSSPDSGQAGDSFTSVTSQAKCAWNFWAL